ncbi:MAG: N-acetylglucosamine kinase [Streptomyces sp.]|uniref:N-acetylglucosamine kinase n=1 Tax=Streptomyces sp. TaxID=1931 RepID=UPI003D6B754A
MGLTTACLAIDAGNSKTDVTVVAADGAVLGSARGDGFQPPTAGVEVAVDALAQTVGHALADAGAGLGRDGWAAGPGGRPPLAHVSACLANADLPREERLLTAALTARGWGRSTHVANDTFAILRAGLPDDGSVRHGVAVVCGAGINCVGRDADGRTHRFPALGRISGDWGGGGGLSAEAIWYAARAEDGRGEPTRLARALPGHFGLPSMYALIEALHMGDLPDTRKHEIAPLLFTVAAAGDPVARALVRRQAEEIVSLTTVTLNRLALLGTATPVFLGGSVAAARHPLLHDHLTHLLADRAPQATTHVVTAPPVLGAALLGLDRAGSAPEAHARLRAHYA